MKDGQNSCRSLSHCPDTLTEVSHTQITWIGHFNNTYIYKREHSYCHAQEEIDAK